MFTWNKYFPLHLNQTFRIQIQQIVGHFSNLPQESIYFSPTLWLNTIKTEQSIVFLLRHSIGTLILNLLWKFQDYYLILAYHTGTTLNSRKENIWVVLFPPTNRGDLKHRTFNRSIDGTYWQTAMSLTTKQVPPFLHWFWHGHCSAVGRAQGQPPSTGEHVQLQ